MAQAIPNLMRVVPVLQPSESHLLIRHGRLPAAESEERPTPMVASETIAATLDATAPRAGASCTHSGAARPHPTRRTIRAISDPTSVNTRTIRFPTAVRCAWSTRIASAGEGQTERCGDCRIAGSGSLPVVVHLREQDPVSE